MQLIMRITIIFILVLSLLEIALNKKIKKIFPANLSSEGRGAGLPWAQQNGLQASVFADE